MFKKKTLGPKAPAYKEDVTVRTLDQLLDVCKVDRDVWEVDHFDANKWEVQTRDSESPLFQIKAWLTKITQDEDDEATSKFFLSQIAKKAPKKFLPCRNSKPKDSDYLLELCIPDGFIGKVSWGKAKKEIFDIDDTCLKFQAAVQDLLSKAPEDKVGKIIFPISGEFFNSVVKPGDEQEWEERIQKGLKILADTIEKLAQVAPTTVVVIHSETKMGRSFYIGEYLKAWFSHHKFVTVDTSKDTFKYQQFGQNLLGYTYGDATKPEVLPEVMAQEKPTEWAKTNTREWHIGVLKKRIVSEMTGCKVRHISALGKAETWEKKQLGTTRVAEAFLYQPQGGLVASFYFLNK